MEMQSFKLDLVKDFGEIGEKRFAVLNNYLGDEYSEIHRIPSGVILINDDKDRHLLVTKNQITLYYSNIEGSIYIDQIILKLFEKLTLEDKQLDAVASCVYHFPASENSFSESLGALREDSVLEQYKFDGVGFRFMRKFEHGLNELKIEPRVNNPEIWFIEEKINFVNSSLQEILEITSDHANSFKYQMFLKSFLEYQN